LLSQNEIDHFQILALLYL